MTDKLRAEWFWTDRWFSSSACCLPICARGLYRELLSRAWSMGAKLPQNHGMLQRLAGVTTDEWERLWPLVEPYWRLQDGHLVNETQQEIYADAMRRKQINTDRARKGAEARWSKARAKQEQCSSNAQASSKHMLKQCPPSPSPSLSLSPEPEPLQETTDPTDLCPAKPGPTNRADDIRAVFVHFQTDHPRAKLSESRKTLIRARLQDGYEVDDLKLAIDGLKLSKWHEENGNLTIEYALRNADKIERLQAVASNPRHADRIGAATRRPREYTDNPDPDDEIGQIAFGRSQEA